MPTIDNFSKGYYVLDSDVLTWDKDRTAAPRDLVEFMTTYAPQPLIKVGSEHSMARAEFGLPSNTVVVPERAENLDNSAVLLAKRPDPEGLLRDADGGGFSEDA